MNLIDMYLKYTEEHEAKEIFHKWCMISSLASILSGRCWTTLGYDILKPNLFVILTGPPASRKTAAINTMLDVLDPLLIEEDLILSSESLTCRQLMNELVENVKSFDYEDATVNYMNLLSVASELKSFLKPGDIDLGTLLLELFDGKVRRHKHATAGCGVAELKNMSSNLLAGTTKDFFLGKEFDTHVRSGLASRLIFLLVEQRRHNNPDPNLDDKLKLNIQKKLFKLVNIAGFIPFSEEGKQEFLDWYGKQPLGVDENVPRAMIPYAGRRQTYVRKLALILWALEYIEDVTIDREVRAIHVKQALKIVMEAEGYIRSAYDTSGRSPDIESIQDVEDFFKLKKGKPVSRKELTEQFKNDIKPEVLESILQMMVTELGSLKTGDLMGRPTYIYIDKKGK